MRFRRISIGRAFAVPLRTEHRDQASICPFALREVSVLAELALGHLRYSLTDVQPQSNSPPRSVLGSDHARECLPTTPGRGWNPKEPVTLLTDTRPARHRPPATLERLAREDRTAVPKQATDALCPTE
ncbi:hypothetical protein J6590_091120 [Homalodisca vitripennis]|nr:hypothetical protein J6590_091120 [Homalodisca vitripennis]